MQIQMKYHPPLSKDTGIMPSINWFNIGTTRSKNRRRSGSRRPAARSRLPSLERLEERVFLHGGAHDLSDHLDIHMNDAAKGHVQHELASPFTSAHLRGNTRTDYLNGAPFQLTWDPVAAADPNAAEPLTTESSSLSTLESIPQLHSNPAATASLFLDFDGHFDATWGAYTNVTTPVFDQDNDPTTFSDGELASMQNIWTVVADDYAPFNINVTTVEPASFANGVSMRVAIGGDGAWSGGTYGGIAYVGSFTNSIVNTVYVFPDNLSNGYYRYTGEASSHEAGHSFGLRHQSQYDTSGNLIAEYYGGSGDGRAPIMGSSYYAARGLWWYGTSVGPNTYQDDMAVLSNATNAFGYRADDYQGATPLVLSGREVSGAGIIERSADQDTFSFTAVAGEMNLSVNVPAGVGNLDARLELRDALGNLLAESDPATFATRRTITYAAGAGDYLLVVASHGIYGDVGQYTISGTISVPSTIATPTNLGATALSVSQIDLSWIDNADNEDGYQVDRSTTGGATWATLTTLAANSNTYSDTTASAGTTYHYRVSGFNSNDVSAYSSQAIVMTGPAAPGTLVATPVWTDRTYLAWEDVAGETGFKVERSFDGGSVWTQIASVGANVTGYQDSGLQAASSYTYRVLATNTVGDSPYTNQASATTLVVPPAAFGPDDGGYIVESWSGDYNDLAILPGGQQILAGGTKYSTDPSAPSDNRMAIARYNVSGSVDTSYGSGGVTAPALAASSENGYGIVLQPDGKAVLAGSVPFRPTVARFNSNGSLDTGFGIGGWNTIDVQADHPFSPAYGVGLQSTGKIVIAGQALNIYTDDLAVVARFTASGAVDSGGGGFGQPTTGYTLTSFGAETNLLTNLALQADNKLVVVGTASGRGLLVARYTANGVLDTTFNGNGYVALLPDGLTHVGGYHGITLQTDGKIVASGTFREIGGSYDMLVARYNTNGTLDTTFGAGSGYVRLDIDGAAAPTFGARSDVLIQPNGKIVVAGAVPTTAGANNILVVRLNADGTPDSTFGPGGFKAGSLLSGMGSPNLSTHGMALLDDGSVIVSGHANWSPAGTSGLQYRHPLLMRFLGDPKAVVTPTSGLITTEVGGQATFTVSLDTQPSADVIIPVSSSDITEGTVSTDSLTFTADNWNVPQTVTITGADDVLADGNIAYTIVLGAASSTDARYSGLDPIDVSVTNTDNDVPPTQFYVVNDATQNRTYEYGPTGTAVEDYALSSGNSAPRGAASTIAGDKTWVVDASKTVYVYDTGGGLLGSWTAGSLAPNAAVEGIATNGTDIWIVDAKSDKVFKYTGAATRLSGSQNAASSFALNSGNTTPKDIVTDGTHLWVVNDSTTDKVFKYTLAGSLVGSWTISSGGGSPTGITIDPVSVSDIWIVDNAADRVYQYTAAASRTSGSQSPASSFTLSAGNTNPQGIADPPAVGLQITANSATPGRSLTAIGSSVRERFAGLFDPAALDQLLAEPESTWTRKSRVKMRG
jgi:uncharacterized delta-60 repeat protein